VCLNARQLPTHRGGVKCRRRLYELKMLPFQCGMWHRIEFAEKHQVHMPNFQAHHTPVVE